MITHMSKKIIYQVILPEKKKGQRLVKYIEEVTFQMGFQR